MASAERRAVRVPSFQTEFVELYCSCMGEETEEMILCENAKCPTEWFHYQCVGLTENTVPDGKWYCDGCTPVPVAEPVASTAGSAATCMPMDISQEHQDPSSGK